MDLLRTKLSPPRLQDDIVQRLDLIKALDRERTKKLTLVCAPAGYARSKPLSWQSGDTFESSTYASANLMWEVLPYLTFGVEYAYGQRENKDNSDVDNHRMSIGIQYY